MDNIIWGAAAAAAIWSATAYTLEQQKRRKEEEARARLEAERANAEARAREQAQREYQAALKAAEEARRQDPNPWAGVDPETADMTEAEKLALYKQSPEYQAYQARMLEWEREQAVAGILSSQKTGLYKLAAPVKDDDPPWWEKIAKAAAQVVAKITESSAQIIRAAQDTATRVVKCVAETAAKTINKTADLAMSLTNSALDGIYGYHGPANPPKDITGPLWMPLPGASPSSPNFILDNYRVNQLHTPVWPSNNECVTAATIQDMNMMQAILADKFGIPELAHMDLPTFAAAFDAQPLWLLRPPADTPIVGGMMHPYAAVAVMRGHADWLRANFGCGYRVELTSGNTVDDLIENLKNGYPTSIHISQEVLLFEDGKFNYLALLGGMPHTVTLAGYDASTDVWKILDPAKADGYREWHTSELMKNWGRHFLLYPPRFSMTTLIPDTTCMPLPSSTSAQIATPVAIPAATPPAFTGIPPTTPTAQPSATPEGGSSVTPVAPAIPTPPTPTGTPTPPQRP